MNKKTRNGRQADLVRLDVHDWYGRVIHRIKGKTTEPATGVAILDLVKDLYNLTDEQIREIHEKQLYLEKKEQMSNADRLRKQINTPLKWKRI